MTGDELKLCFQAKPEQHPERPTDFTCPEKSGRLLIVFKKQKP